jgi:hypothetical protein
MRSRIHLFSRNLLGLVIIIFSGLEIKVKMNGRTEGQMQYHHFECDEVSV